MMRIFVFPSPGGDYFVMAKDKYDAVRVFHANHVTNATPENVKDMGSNILWAQKVYRVSPS